MRKREYLFNNGFRIQYPMARGFYRCQKDNSRKARRRAKLNNHKGELSNER